MTGPVCYIERTGSGSLIRAIRLVGDRLDRVWAMPVPREGEPADPGATVEQTRAAARWVAQQLPAKGQRSLSSVCVDIDGGLCLWLSAPSADASIVAAAMSQGRSADDGGAGEGAGAAGLLSLAAAGVGMERSVQALAGSGGAGPRRSSLPFSGARPVGERRRMAVLSVPDLTVRIFLDELDALGVEVDAVATFWHAMAAAWNPDRRRDGRSDAAEERIAASQTTCSAVVVLDPGTDEGGDDAAGGGGGGGGSGGGGAGGRLIWSWAAGGELVAGGTMRLRTIATPTAPAPVEASPEGARRIEVTESSERMLVCGAPEAGRLIADWLAWSAQLGVGPSRVICVGPMPATDDDSPGLVELLAQGWHGASVDAAVHPDPVGATLERFGDPNADTGQGAADPRSALVELSHRPGRAHRRMYRWGAAALAIGSVAVGVLGWRLSAAAKETAAGVGTMRADLTASLSGMSTIVPNLATPVGMADPEAVLRNALQDFERNRPKLDQEMPILAELDRLLEAMSIPNVNPEMKLQELSISSISASARLILPQGDALTGPMITVTLGQLPGDITWTGDSRGGLAGQTTLTWNLNGVWTPRSQRGPSGPIAGGRR